MTKNLHSYIDICRLYFFLKLQYSNKHSSVIINTRKDYTSSHNFPTVHFAIPFSDATMRKRKCMMILLKVQHIGIVQLRLANAFTQPICRTFLISGGGNDGCAYVAGVSFARPDHRDICASIKFLISCSKR